MTKAIGVGQIVKLYDCAGYTDILFSKIYDNNSDGSFTLAILAILTKKVEMRTISKKEQFFV